MKPQASLIPVEHAARRILFIRGHKVMLDSDLAELYGVATRAVNQAVKRNRSRFPADFMFKLTAREVGDLNRSQIVTGSQKHRDPKYPPYAFTEHGVVMLSSVLRSERAVQVNIAITRAFVRLREILASNADLARKLAALEKSTTRSSRWCSTRSGSSWSHLRRTRRSGRSGSTRTNDPTGRRVIRFTLFCARCAVLRT